MKVKSKNKFQSIDIVVLALLALYTVTLIVLLGWGLLSSLKTYEDMKLGNYFGLPNLSLKDSKEAFAFGNYLKILFGNTFEIGSVDASYESILFGEVENSPDVVFGLTDFLFYSFLYSIVCSFVHAFVAFTCAFLCAKYKFRFSEFIYVLMLIVMAIPIVGAAPSMLIFLRDLGIYDTVFAMVAMNFNFTGVYFFVFHAHLSGLSNTYMEAAEIDGASQFGIYLKIIFPLCAKVFFTVFLLQFIQTWNDYQTPLLYYPNHPTLSYAVFKAVRDTSKGGLNELSIPNKVASCMVLALPILIVFIAFNKVLMGNITMGGLKE
ncbi:MAG: carbohydrate ABC transporter permease [Clostridia bacterium]|nr:carbohydrate ABC transporter permease [Clostridia bacterium]